MGTNLSITNVDPGCVEVEGGKFRDELLTYAGAHTTVAGTLLARRAVAAAVVASAVAGGGTGTVTAATVIGGKVVPSPGIYTLRCMVAVTNGGEWQLEDPNGMVIATGLKQTVGAGVATVFKVQGLQFTITDAGTDFSAGATATLTVAADGKIVPFAIAGVGGVQRPIGVLTYQDVKAGSGDNPIRMFIEGRVKKERLIIDADGTGVNITAAILDELRAAGVNAIDAKQIAALDNQ